MDRFPRYELALCSKHTAYKQEVQKDYVYNAVFIEQRRSRRELSKYVLGVLKRVLEVNHDA